MTDRPTRPRTEMEKGWPSYVRSVGLDDLDRLGLDNEGRLYWNGKPVEVRRTLNLKRWERIGAIVIAVSAGVGAVAGVVAAGAAVISAYVDASSHKVNAAHPATMRRQ